MTKYLAVLVILITTGCGGVITQPRPNSYYDSQGGSSPSEPLFGDAGNTLVDEDIERILNHRLVLPDQNRIAVLKLSTENDWRYYSNDFTELTESIVTEFIGQLKSSPRVFDASFLPGMLIPERRSIPFLREAAARYQADLLLVYRELCRTYQKYKFVDASETKVFCTVEAVLLDVRSGIVPFSTVSTHEYAAQKERDDTNFRETIRKAELAAIAMSLKEAAFEVKNFLTNLDAP